MFFGVHRYITASVVDSVFTVLSEVSLSGDVGVILFSGGGDIDEAYIIANYLQDIVSGKLTVYVPRYAKSAATLIACAGDEIVMLPVAELGPIDPVLHDPKTDRYVPLQSILEVVDLLARKNVPREIVREFVDRLPVIELGDYARAVDHNIELAAKILAKRMFKQNPNKAKEVARKLASYKQHSAAITPHDAQEIGLKIRKANQQETKQLWKIHTLWYKHIIKTEYEFKETETEAIEFKLWKGITATITPQEIIEETQR